MTDSTSRLYAGAADLQAMMDLLIAVRPATRIAEYPRVVDSEEMLEIPNLQANTRLWEDGARQLVGFAIVHVTFGNLLFEANPQAASDIETQIIAWGIEHTRRAGQGNGQLVTLDTSFRDDDTDRIALLE